MENVKYTDLTSKIAKEYHLDLKKRLPETEASVFKILKAHFDESHEVLIKVHRLYSQLKNSLELLSIKKEILLFPRIVDYDKNPSVELLEDINVLIKEVELGLDAVEKILKEIRRVTKDYELPETACMTFDKTYKDLEEIEELILESLSIERDILYKRLKEESIN